MISPDWIEVQPFPFAAARRTFTGAAERDGSIAIRYLRRPDKSLVAVARFGPLSVGAPGQAHGGAVLTVLDEALGAALWIDGLPGITVRLNSEFRRRVPLNSEFLVETRVTRRRSRLAWVEGELLSAGGVCHARADAEFLLLDKERLRRLYAGELP
ncbi:MAG: PaaI family thioesterase [Elusimicrobia bacterium]|nr:PaaI family thioesterase [Elusimicrobiota bacterium]